MRARRARSPAPPCRPQKSKAGEGINSKLQLVIKSGKFTLPSFGTFTVRKTKARKGLNPRTGEAIPIQARRVVTFHASHKLKEQIQGDGPAAESTDL